MRGSSLPRRLLAFVCCIVFVLAGSGESAITDSISAAADKSEISLTEQKLNDLRAKQEELDKKIAETEGELSKEQENQEAIKEQIQLVQDTLLELEKSSAALEDRIDKLNSEISESSEKAAVKRREIEQETAQFGKRLRIMYITGNETYTELILSSGDFYDMLMKMELVKRVASHDAAVLKALIAKKNEYETEQAELEEKRSELQEQLEKLKEQKRMQNDQMHKLNTLFSKSKEMIEKLENDKEAFLADQQENNARQDAFEAALEKLRREQEALKKAEEEDRKHKEQQTGGSAPSQTEPPKNNGSYGYTDKSMFTWPCPGFYYISYGVGWRWGAYHQGIDIYSGNIRGAAICAAAEGTVILVDNGCTHDYGKNSNCCRSGYGNYCIIDHGNGWWTLYGHSEKMNVVAGQRVAKGQKLGTVGSTGYSTGPHLHFEIRRNGEIVDPKLYV